MKTLKLIWPVFALALLTACSGCKNFTVNDAIVTIKEAGDSISREYASLHKAGKITAEQDAKAEEIHAKYRQAMGVLAIALEAQKVGKDAGSVAPALRAAKDAIAPLLDMITPFLMQAKTDKLEKQLTTAKAE